MKLRLLGGLVLSVSMLMPLSSALGQGTRSLDLAKIIVGARQAGMGGAFVGLGDDINTMSFNMAGLSQVNRYSLAGSVNDWVAGSSYGFATLGIPRKIGTFAASLSYFNQTEVEETDHNGTPTGETRSAYDVRASLGYGTKIHRLAHFGAGITLTQNKLGSTTKGYGGVDAGFLFPLMQNKNKVNLGLAVRNFAVNALKTTPDTGDDLPPTSISAGLGFMIHSMDAVKINLGADVYMPFGDEGGAKGNLGAEFVVKNVVALRAGYRANSDEETMTLGAGIHYGDFWLDYAYSGMDYLDEAHRVSVRMDFGAYQSRGAMFGDDIDRGDKDGDGIENYLDRCPLDPEDKDGYEDYDGCPDPDNDHDGIPDKEDQCPLLPETYNNHDDKDGCPDLADLDSLFKSLENLKRGGYVEHYQESGVLLTELYSYIVPIYFDTDKAILRPEAYKLLEEVSKLIKEQDIEGLLFIEGHTDNRNNHDYNQQLSENRAKAVKEALVTRYGVPSAILIPIGMGETQPVAPNDSEENMQKNRRVIFRVYQKEEVKNR